MGEYNIMAILKEDFQLVFDGKKQKKNVNEVVREIEKDFRKDASLSTFSMINDALEKKACVYKLKKEKSFRGEYPEFKLMK